MTLTASGAYARPQPVPKMPTGLVELMEDLTRNVLRHNPTNVYEFCAAHMEKLLEIREECVPKPVLTLEQKIARVQEKMNKKAELRKQQYDKQMQLYRLNKKLEQTSERCENKMESSRDEPTNSPETRSKEDDNKPTIPNFLEQNQTLQSIMVKDKSNESIETFAELNTKESLQDVLIKNDEEGNKLEESVETDPGQDMNILLKPKDSIETENVEQDIVMLNKTIESVTEIDNIEDVVSKNDEEVNILKDSKETDLDHDSIETKIVEQDIVMLSKSNESVTEIENIEDVLPKNDEEENILKGSKETDLNQDLTIGTKCNDSIEKHIEMLNKSDESITDKLVKGKSEDVKNKPEDSEENSSLKNEVKMIQKVAESALSYLIEDKTAFSYVSEDKSEEKYHEKDFGMQSKTISMTLNQVKDEKSHLDISKCNPQDSLENEMVKIKKLEDFFEESIEADHTTSSAVEDKSKGPVHHEQDLVEDLEVEIFHEPSEMKKENMKLSTDTQTANDKFENLIDTPDINFAEPEKKGISEIPAALSQENILNIENKADNLIPNVPGVDIMESVYNQHINGGVEELIKNITNHDVAKQNDNKKENDLDIKNVPPSDSVSEIPMQKKTYALLLPEKTSDSETEPVTSKNETRGENVTSDKIDKIGNNTAKIDENFKTSNEEFVSGIKETTNTIKVIDSSILDPQASENTDETKEKNENDPDDIENNKKNIENTTQHNPDYHIERKADIKELNSKNENQEFDKVSSEKYNETCTSSDDIKNESEKAGVEKTGDSDENLWSKTENTQKTETSVLNDSADESTVGDSNDSLMDQDVESITRSEENIKSPSTMDLETAAVTIQKVFRSFLFKSRCSTFEDKSTDEPNPITEENNVSHKEEVEYPITTERRILGITRMDTVLQTVNEEKSLSLSTDDSSTLSSAATVIQAHVRGFLARNKFNSNKTSFNASLVNSDGPSTHSLEADEQQKKTILNIHIVPEGNDFLSRDESIITSMDLSLDGTPPSSVNLHPLGYDKSEPRKQLKREDAIQSISPPSNNSGMLSEDVDSVKEMVINVTDLANVCRADTDIDSDVSPTRSSTLETVVERIKVAEELSVSSEPEVGIKESDLLCKRTLTKMSSDEGDVVTPFEEYGQFSTDSDQTSGLLHSGEFHDIVLPTKVTRNDTSVVRGE